ncbi:MAG: sigma-70 family RNA polymerase sigma factor [Planctomycetes bacterium]|nr:sigma-70 family RNA polymerase sigma factor [Planctomycetota bacterium]
MHEPESSEALMEVVYDELREVAARYFRRQPAGFTLRPTEIVHEACMHMMQHGQIEWTSANHFRAIAIRKIWQIIVDHLKYRQAKKRGGPGVAARSDGASLSPTRVAANGQTWKRIPLEGVCIEWPDRTIELIDLADALDALRAESTRLHEVVMLHWFGGMTHTEVAENLKLSSSTVAKDFRYALAWLNQRFQQDTNSRGHRLP